MIIFKKKWIVVFLNAIVIFNRASLGPVSQTERKTMIHTVEDELNACKSSYTLLFTPSHMQVYFRAITRSTTRKTRRHFNLQQTAFLSTSLQYKLDVLLWFEKTQIEETVGTFHVNHLTCLNDPCTVQSTARLRTLCFLTRIKFLVLTCYISPSPVQGPYSCSLHTVPGIWQELIRC